MIKCYAIVPQIQLEVLAEYCGKYPLTYLEISTKTRLSAPDLLGAGVKVLFIDESLKKDHKSMLKSVGNHISIIYISYDSAGAFNAFEDGALDFLLYPFSYPRFELSMNKLVKTSLLTLPKNVSKRSEPMVVESFFVKPDLREKIEVLINCNDVLFIEACQNDVAIQMADGRRYIYLSTMKEMEENLSGYFIRVHKSFIINAKKIAAFDGVNIIMETSKKFFIPLGGVYRKSFLEMCNKMMIRKPHRELESPMLRKALSIFIVFLTLDFGLINELPFI